MTIMERFTARVADRTVEARDIISLELVAAQGGALPPWSPGSHIDLHLGEGLIRQYSLINGPGETDFYRIAVQREIGGRGGSKAVHDRLGVGDELQISAPRNNFELVKADHYTLLAGGIGITPILSMARHLASLGADFVLHYCARNEDRAAFRELLSAPEFEGKVFFHLDDGPRVQLLDLSEFLSRRPTGGHLYLCGPQGFMQAVEQAAEGRWPQGSIHVEYFSADPAALTREGDTFQVRLAKSGGTYTIPEGKTIVDALAEQGVIIETSCEQGVCGTCLTAVIEGVPDHRDDFLMDDEKAANNQILPCVSRSKRGLLVLDL